MTLKFTGERYLPWTLIGEIHYEHLHRYYFAKKFVNKKSVLDLACGEGYGSDILATSAKEVVGVDINREIILHAQKKYQKNNLTFLEGNLLKLPFTGDQKFDVVVCFEALEHVKEQSKVLDEIKKYLKKDGTLIISTPNKDTYKKNLDLEDFHQKELTKKEFLNLLKKTGKM